MSCFGIFYCSYSHAVSFLRNILSVFFFWPCTLGCCCYSLCLAGGFLYFLFYLEDFLLMFVCTLSPQPVLWRRVWCTCSSSICLPSPVSVCLCSYFLSACCCADVNHLSSSTFAPVGLLMFTFILNAQVSRFSVYPAVWIWTFYNPVPRLK